MFGLSYWVLPLFAGLTWLGTLLGMLLWWVVDKHEEHFSEMTVGQYVPYISDIGATNLEPLFIAGSTVSVVVFDIAFLSERWLRHRGRLTHNYNLTEKILSVFASIFAVIGAAGLITLSICNTLEHHTIHDTMLVVFIVGYIISAIFVCAEYQRLGMHWRGYRILRISFWVKLAFIFIEVALAVAFAVLNYKEKYNAAGVCEWTISLFYIFYQISFVIDFWPAIHTKSHDSRFPPVKRADDEMAMETQDQGNMLGGPVYTSGGYGNADAESGHGSELPIAQRNSAYYPPTYPPAAQQQPASRNF